MTYMYGYPDNYVFSLKNIIPEQISPCDIISSRSILATIIPTTKRNEGPRGYVVHTSYKFKKKQTCILYVRVPILFLFFDNSLLEKHLIDFSFFGDRISCNLLGRSRRSRQGRSHNCCNRPWSFDHI